MPHVKEKFSQNQELIAKFSNAMGNPVRVSILQSLSRKSCCYHGDMAEDLPIAKSTLSQHLKVLLEAGLIQGEITPPKTKYCINRENWNLAKGLLIGFFD
jgi:ArsR family transcriptional regulator